MFPSAEHSTVFPVRPGKFHPALQASTVLIKPFFTEIKPQNARIGSKHPLDERQVRFFMESQKNGKRIVTHPLLHVGSVFPAARRHLKDHNVSNFRREIVIHRAVDLFLFSDQSTGEEKQGLFVGDRAVRVGTAPVTFRHPERSGLRPRARCSGDTSGPYPPVVGSGIIQLVRHDRHFGGGVSEVSYLIGPIVTGIDGVKVRVRRHFHSIPLLTALDGR